MPNSNPYGVGASLNAGAFATKRHDIALTADGPTASFELLCPGMSRLTFWVNQAAGQAVTFQPQFMVRATTGIIAPVDEWLPLSAPVTAVIGTPTLLNFQIVAVKIRLAITRVPGGGAPTVSYVLTCSA